MTTSPDRSEQTAGPAPGARAGARDLTAADLALINRMTVTSQVLPNAAHELNNALQVVGAVVEMLSLRTDLPPDVREKVGRIGSQTGRAVGLVRELVAFARRDDPGAQTCDLDRVAEQALALRRYYLSRQGIDVEVERAEGGSYRVLADGHSMEHILLNLIINAEQALAGRPGGRIRIRLDRSDGSVRIAVADNGPGMAPETQRRAVEPFFTTRTEGVGLGLPVAASLAAQQGGSLRLERSPEGGVTAIVTLPSSESTGA